MTSLPTPNWVLNEDHSIYRGQQDSIVLKEGTFARPLDIGYVPDHIKETPENKYFNGDTEVYCYTPKGILALPLSKLSKI